MNYFVFRMVESCFCVVLRCVHGDIVLDTLPGWPMPHTLIILPRLYIAIYSMLVVFNN